MNIRWAIIISIITGLWQACLIWYGDLGITSDAIAYLKLSNSVFTEHPFFINNHLITQWPPLYPILIGVIAKVFSVTVFTAMKIWAVISGVGITYLFCRLVKDIQTKYVVLLLLMFWGAGTSVYFRSGLSESLFVILLLLSLILSFKILENPSLNKVLLTGFVFGLMMLTRFAAAGVIGGITIYFILRTKNWKLVIALAIITIIVVLPWFWYISTANSSVAVRKLGVHVVSFDHLKGLLGTIVRFINPLNSFWILPIFAIATFFLLIRIKGHGFNMDRFKKELFLHESLYLWILVTYTIFIFSSISFLDFNLNFNTRIMLPAFIMFILWLSEKLNKIDNRSSYLVLATAVLYCGNIISIGQQSYVHMNEGFRYTSKKWKKSELKAEIQKQNTVLFYSNAANVMEYYGLSNTIRIPLKIINKNNNVINHKKDYESLIANLKYSKAKLAMFDDKKYYSKYYSLQDIEQELGGTLRKEKFEDGIIYFY